MIESYIYLSYPYKFRIAIIKAGFYAAGQYYEIEADQFNSHYTNEIYGRLLFEDYQKEPFPLRNCDSCAKRCHNITIYVSCCGYVPMPGLEVIPKYMGGTMKCASG